MAAKINSSSNSSDIKNSDQAFLKRMRELYDRAYNQGRYIFTDFLTPYELSLFLSVYEKSPNQNYKITGGPENAERCMIRFGSEDTAGYEMPFPIVCIRIKPVLLKFADDLSHRDFLGAIMNLGIERDKIGDIIIKEKVGYLFCHENVSEYIMENLSFIKHTHIKCDILDEVPEESKPELEDKNLIVNSNRIDAIISKVYNLSRDKSLQLFMDKKVFVNGRLEESNSKPLKASEVVSVRGYGKFIFNNEGGMTQKKKLYVSVSVYI